MFSLADCENLMNRRTIRNRYELRNTHFPFEIISIYVGLVPWNYIMSNVNIVEFNFITEHVLTPFVDSFPEFLWCSRIDKFKVSCFHL